MDYVRFAGICLIGLCLLSLLQPSATNAAVLTVTSNGDTIALDTFLTLREAITSINNQADINNDVTVNRVGNYASQSGGTPDVINFNIAGAGLHKISVTGTPEPTIIKPLTINGYSQNGASTNTLANSDNAVILIQLDGTNAGAGANGLTLASGSAGSTIKGLDIVKFSGNGIVIQSNGNAISGNFVGVDPTGTTRGPNGTFPNRGDGIRIANASNNQIGSTSVADRNIASGNALAGIHIIGTLTLPASGNLIQGNFVGVAADGTSNPLPANGSQPAGIVLGTDGNLWFTAFSDNAIGRITPAGVITEFSLGALQSGSGPADIASNPGNNRIYFTETNVGRIGSLDPLAGSDAAIRASITQSAVVPSGSGAAVAGITAGPDGNLWFTEQGAARVGNVNPTLTTIIEFVAGITAGSGPLNIGSGADGALWFTESSNNAIGRITTSGTVTEFSLAALGAATGPTDIVNDPGNNLLYFTLGNTGRIARINPLAGSDANILASETQSAVVPSGSGAGVRDLTLGPDGNLWFTEVNSNRVCVINPTLTTITEFIGGITAGSGPDDIATGPDGAFWFTEFNRSAIGRITTSGNVSEFSLPVTSPSNDIAGIEISGGNLNTIGGTGAGARNVVGFNADGIELDNGSQQNIIQGNFAGVGADGNTGTKNTLHGIVLRSSNGFGPPLGPAQPNEPGVSFNLIGGTAAGAGNLIEFNAAAGVAVFDNPVSASGQPNVGNAIEGNSIFENGRDYQSLASAPTPLIGIDLTNSFLFPRDDGVTPNDSKGHGAANDPNNFQNFPVLTSAKSFNGAITITGSLHASPSTTYRIEFFASDSDPLGLPAEGQQFLGFTNATTDSNGDASFNPSFNVIVAGGRAVTATATDPVGNTSEFSAGIANVVCDSDPPVITVPSTVDAVAQKKKVNGQKGAFVFFNVSAFDPEDGPVPAIANPPSGSFFPIGTTIVQVTATDHCGNTSAASFAVTVAKKRKRHAPI